MICRPTRPCRCQEIGRCSQGSRDCPIMLETIGHADPKRLERSGLSTMRSVRDRGVRRVQSGFSALAHLLDRDERTSCSGGRSSSSGLSSSARPAWAMTASPKAELANESRWRVADCLESGRSAIAVNGNFEGLTELPHPDVAEATDPFREGAEANALDRVQVSHAVPWHGVVAGFEDNLTGQATDGRGARSDDCPPKARNGGVAGQHDDRPSTNVGKLTPPYVSPSRQRTQDAAAETLNDARSPHSSFSSSGWSS